MSGQLQLVRWRLNSKILIINGDRNQFKRYKRTLRSTKICHRIKRETFIWLRQCFNVHQMTVLRNNWKINNLMKINILTLQFNENPDLIHKTLWRLTTLSKAKRKAETIFMLNKNRRSQLLQYVKNLQIISTCRQC